MMLITLALPGSSVDDLGRAVLELGVDQLPHRLGIFVLELLGLELAGLALDQLLGEIERFLVDLDLGDLLEQRLGGAHLVGVAQHFEQQALCRTA